MRIPRLAAVVCGAALLGAVVSASGPSALAGSHAAPAIDPSNFVRHVTNPFFPLKPGTRYFYRGVSDGEVQHDRVFVTYRTKRILGVRTTVVKDVVSGGGHVLERTRDWYAQDKKGNVWYFGEATKSFENGQVSTEGSWQAGVNGARAGIIMEADPRVSDGYRQEFYKGHAEDQAWVLRRGGTVDVPFGHLRHRLVTLEWSPLEPDIFAKKINAKGFGIVKEISVTGPRETNDLVRVHHQGS